MILELVFTSAEVENNTADAIDKINTIKRSSWHIDIVLLSESAQIHVSCHAQKGSGLLVVC